MSYQNRRKVLQGVGTRDELSEEQIVISSLGLAGR